MRLVSVLLLGGLHPRTPARAPVGRCPVNGARFALLLALLVCHPLRSGGARPAPRTVGLRPPFGGGGRCRHSRGVPRPRCSVPQRGGPRPRCSPPSLLSGRAVARFARRFFRLAPARKMVFSRPLSENAPLDVLSEIRRFG